MAWVHNLNPFLIEFSPGVGLRWYGLAYLSGFICGYWLILYLSRRKLVLLTPTESGDFVFAVALGTILGGRIGYCLFYSPELLIDFRSSPPFWGALALHQGGMSAHGGMVGIAAACWLYSRRHGVSMLHLGDLGAVGGSLGILFGRLANFINGELVGRPCDPSAWYAVKFPQDIFGWAGENPARLHTLSNSVGLIGVPPDRWSEILDKAGTSNPAWRELNLTLERLVEAVQNGNEAVRQSLGAVLTARYPSQLFEAFAEGLVLFSLLAIFWSKPRKPGVVAGVFLTCYSVARIICEHFRLPDAQIGYEIFGLTRGQILSFFMLLASAVGLWFWANRSAEKVGGWAEKPALAMGE
jgi:phosphatidylglycerol:prolipoprotein diacylglycerol transferase